MSSQIIRIIPEVEAVISCLVNMHLWASDTYLFLGECVCVHECLFPLGGFGSGGCEPHFLRTGPGEAGRLQVSLKMQNQCYS